MRSSLVRFGVLAWIIMLSTVVAPNCAQAKFHTHIEEGDVIVNALTSYYGKGFQGKPTASGEVFDKRAYTLAVPEEERHVWCMGTEVLVQYEGVKLRARITDTGSFGRKYGRQFDFSEGMARKLGFIEEGTARVTLTVLEKGEDCRPARLHA